MSQLWTLSCRVQHLNRLVTGTVVQEYSVPQNKPILVLWGDNTVSSFWPYQINRELKVA